MILIRPQARLKIGAVTVLKEVWFPLVLGPSSPALLTLGRFQVSSMGKGDDGGGDGTRALGRVLLYSLLMQDQKDVSWPLGSGEGALSGRRGTPDL